MGLYLRLYLAAAVVRLPYRVVVLAYVVVVFAHVVIVFAIDLPARAVLLTVDLLPLPHVQGAAIWLTLGMHLPGNVGLATLRAPRLETHSYPQVYTPD